MYAWRWILFFIIATAFFVTALSNDVYNLTSPPGWTLHVLLRKSYSIIAFAVVGALFVWASGASVRRSALVIGAYSAGIEVGQHVTNGGREPFYWNVVDTLCGAVGGALGALIPWVRAKSSAGIFAGRSSRRHRRV